jgi:8-oxo-dGTP pyrophosphatase MutT (NUDIX family)
MDFYQALKEELTLPLPGITFQIKMAPKHRKLDYDGVLKQNAAVSIVIIPSEKEEKGILLIKRPEYDGHHSGQVSFPGGKEEQDDENLVQTAIRETYEEIGINLVEDHLIGTLTPLFIPVSRYMVHPYVFLENEIKEFTIDPNEVEYVIHIPIKELLDDSLVKTTRIEISDRTITTPYFDIEEEIVWGATAMMLAEFLEILYRLKRKNPGLI